MSIQITSNITKRLIYFIGHPKEKDSILICQICKNYETISTITTGECATRTLLNLYNLHAVRGPLDQNDKLIVKSSMSGPHHYYGWIDPRNTYIIKLINKSLQYCEIDNLIYNISNYDKQIDPFNSSVVKISSENYEWIKGEYLNDKNRKKYSIDNEIKNYISNDYKVDSLFDNPGVLLLNLDNLQIPLIEYPQHYNLSSYKVQVVKNERSFKFNQYLINKYKHAQHKLRVITYNYGTNYVDNYLMNGSGIFIEKHEFIQAITPCNSDCSGFVILGKIDKNKNLNLIAIKLPYGFTLLVEPEAIHGDSTLTGLYMMAMTGNHNAMKTADTVFLKNRLNNNNVKITAISDNNDNNNDNSSDSSDNLLLSSSTNSNKKIKKLDSKLKDYIWSNLNFIEKIYWESVIFTPNKSLGWDKTRYF